jgi:hypothetical protein
MPKALRKARLKLLDSEKPQRNAMLVMLSSASEGSASSLRQLARRRSRIDCATVIIDGHVEDAVSKGAKLLCGATHTD